jgi:tetratricopeptide (TPR) repeat protein
MTMIGVNPGHPAPMPYMEGWGVIEKAGGAEDVALLPGSDVENGPHHFALGQAYEGAGRLTEATAEYRQAIVLEPGDPRYHLALGEALRAQGEMEQAMAAYTEVTVLAPEVAWPHFALGEIWLHAGEHNLALAEYERAIAMSPNLSEARFALANLDEEQGLLRRAYEHYEVLSRFLYDPYHSAASEAMQRIEEQW